MSRFTIYSLVVLFYLAFAVVGSPVPQTCTGQPLLAGAARDPNGKLIAALPLQSSGTVPVRGSVGFNGQANTNLPVKASGGIVASAGLLPKKSGIVTPIFNQLHQFAPLKQLANRNGNNNKDGKRGFK